MLARAVIKSTKERLRLKPHTNQNNMSPGYPAPCQTVYKLKIPSRMLPGISV